MIQQTPENKEQLGKYFADILENFATGTTVSIHWDIPKLPTQASGIYASAIINEDDLSQLNKLESHGLIQIDQATNVVEDSERLIEVMFEMTDEFIDSAI